jgi:formamidopyrimidine-DNA glycosylase
MPELPEVETVVRGLRDAGLVGHRIEGVNVRWAKTIQGLSPERFARLLRGRRVESVGRRAKYIVLTLDAGWTILVHLRMTGRLRLAPAGESVAPHEHLELRLDDGRTLRFTDARKFGRWLLTRTPEQTLGRLGPEPLDRAFTVARFRALLVGRRGMLKPLLLNQAVLAGLGNIYVDEALWDARLHPCLPADQLDARAQRALHAGIRKVLRRGVAAAGTSLGKGLANFYSVAGRRGRNQDDLRVFRRTGEPCPRCRTAIQRIVVGQRSTHLCPRCQPNVGEGTVKS